jgi:glycosyltransferase involved in cell wall biosynthesis
MTKNVAILLCTMQGHTFLREQLDSIEGQTHASWSIWASDDSPDHKSHAILTAYQARLGPDRLTMQQGPQKGFAANFLSLACSGTISADYFAYADQDDIWESDKLERAVQWLQSVPDDVPALYCGRTRKVDENNQDLGFSPLFTRPPGFANALVQSIASGNTMVFNRAARHLLQIAGPALPVAAHDWWTYLLVSGSGGQVLYDPLPTVRYRQHGDNLIGTKGHWRKRLAHGWLLLRGNFRNWNGINITALQTMRSHLTVENQGRLDEFVKARNSGLLVRVTGCRRAGVYRQSWFGNLGLVAAVVLKRI